MRSKTAFLTRDYLPYLFAVSISILLSLFINVRETLINPDAICYLLSAQALETVGIRDAMHLCAQAEWPFYSALIYGAVRVFHLPYTFVAYSLDGLFSLLSVVMFILIVKELAPTSSRRLLWLAAATILLAHEFNSVREYIVRDHGYWAFYLTSLFFMLRYMKQATLNNALAFSGSLLLATLFRIEGAVFLLALPWVAWIYPNTTWRQRTRYFLTLNLPLLIVAVVASIWMISHPQMTLGQFGRVQDLVHQMIYGVTTVLQRFQEMQHALMTQVLTSESAQNAGMLLSLVMLAWYLLSIMGNVSWIYAALVIYAWQQKAVSFAKGANRVLGAYLAINIGITLLFLLERQFLSKRYLIALSLTLMLWVPFGLDQLIERASSTQRKFALYLAVFFIAISAAGGIISFGYSKTYIRAAGDWMAQNIPASAQLYANDIQLMYYAQHNNDRIFADFPAYANVNMLAHEHWKQYDYLAFRLSKQQEGDIARLLRDINQSPIQVFQNSRGDRVVIYKIGVRT